MRLRLLLIIVGLSILLASCKDSPTQLTTSEQIDILEVAGRHRINSYVAYDTIFQPVVYFLAVGRIDSTGVFAILRDPDDELMLRFAASQPPVKPYSACQRPWITDKETGNKGRLFAFTNPVVQNDHSVLDGVDYTGLSADLFRMYLRHYGVSWRVDSIQGRGSIN
jgi:hypothetical protein